MRQAGFSQSVRLVMASVVIAAAALLAGEILERYGRRKSLCGERPLKLHERASL